MDFNKCFSILQERMVTSQENGGGSVQLAAVSPPVATPPIVVEFSSTTPRMELIKMFHDLQADRIKTYAYFDKELDEIIAGNYPARYPHICNEVTQKFAGLSRDINAIKEEFRSRGNTEISTCIANIQSAEKEKLTLVAAHHLDRLKTTVLAGSEHLTGTKTEEQEKYLAEKVAACQSTIAEAMEELQCCLCDLE